MEKDSSNNGKGIAGIIILAFLFLAWGERTIHDAAYDNGYEEGYQDGYSNGFDDGYSEGYDEGYNEGYSNEDIEDAYNTGYDDRIFDLYNESNLKEVEEVISILEERKQDLLDEEDEIVESLMKK